jgi:hypothetical protein
MAATMMRRRKRSLPASASGKLEAPQKFVLGGFSELANGVYPLNREGKISDMSNQYFLALFTADINSLCKNAMLPGPLLKFPRYSVRKRVSPRFYNWCRFGIDLWLRRALFADWIFNIDHDFRVSGSTRQGPNVSEP